MDLPSEIWQEVASHLEIRDIRSLREVCVHSRISVYYIDTLAGSQGELVSFIRHCSDNEIILRNVTNIVMSNPTTFATLNVSIDIFPACRKITLINEFIEPPTEILGFEIKGTKGTAMRLDVRQGNAQPGSRYFHRAKFIISIIVRSLVISELYNWDGTMLGISSNGKHTDIRMRFQYVGPLCHSNYKADRCSSYSKHVYLKIESTLLKIRKEQTLNRALQRASEGVVLFAGESGIIDISDEKAQQKVILILLRKLEETYLNYRRMPHCPILIIVPRSIDRSSIIGREFLDSDSMRKLYSESRYCEMCDELPSIATASMMILRV